jgi:programmed cell death 6-interacting protein
MLTFALKQTSAVQLAKVATTYLGKNYDKNVVQRVTPIVTEMDNLRTRVVAISAAKSAEEASLEILAIYHRHVVAMESRLPLGPKSVNIKLSWTDTLSRNKISEQSWALEKLCIMFNMAAVYSQVGGQIPRNSPENKKKAIQCFKSAAGCLDIVRNLSRELKGVQNIVDLRADALQMRISICMAQAYLSFYETMDKQTTSKSILARVAITINRYYS